ncbi:hypothetical protein EB796_013639 [Bugula neritina]|uniref:Uncharacterized protein n=1 Tax=Bugula neritina TaxID=10212 RepID=A0A7J7JNX0_BUGNE|nr:hypothetical protein EB796_013639 [Bugula neritina]
MKGMAYIEQLYIASAHQTILHTEDYLSDYITCWRLSLRLYYLLETISQTILHTGDYLSDYITCWRLSIRLYYLPISFSLGWCFLYK